MLQRYFIGNHKNEDICKKSSSGGAFTAITDAAFQEEKNTVVYGCILNEKLDALHIRATSIQERDKMRGSKYISSNMGDCFELVEKDLKNDKFIIFSGTPCQIAGLYSYLNVKNLDVKRLLTIEVICHGVGSNKFFHDYVEHLEKSIKVKQLVVILEQNINQENFKIWKYHLPMEKNIMHQQQNLIGFILHTIII